MSVRPKALLFDLGGVVIDIDFTRVFRVWAEHAGCEVGHIRGRFRMDDLYKDHETGRITAAEFFAGLKRTLDVDLNFAQFLEGWNALFVGEVTGIAHALKLAAKHFPLYAFSNTNEAHRAFMYDRYAEILGYFQTVFVSSSMGVRKPESEAFHRVVKEMGCRPSEILFFDDTLENIEGAKECALQVVHVRGIKDVIGELNARIA